MKPSNLTFAIELSRIIEVNMEKMKSLIVITMVIALSSFIMAGAAFYQAQQAKSVALSDLIVEEQETLSLPILDQSTKSYGYISIYELAISNNSGPDVILTHVEKVTSGFDFIVPLKSEEIVNVDLDPVAFISDASIAEIRNNPRLLKDLMKNDMGDKADVGLKIKAGGSKKIVIGVAVQPYDAKNSMLANFVLTSFSLKFDNGKTHIFRRGFPIMPIQ